MILKLKKYLKSQKTGQIVIKFKDESHLCKVSVEGGEVVYISIGNRQPDETIEYIKNKEIEDVNFIEGIKPLKKVDSPLTEELLKTFRIDEDIVTPVETDLKDNEVIPFEKVQSVMEIFIDTIGPLGPVLLEKILKKIRYEKGRPMDGALYSEFLSCLLKEIPDEKKDFFKNKIL